MHDSRASVEVRALIGEEGLHQLHGDAFPRYHRWRYSRTGRATGSFGEVRNHPARRCPA